jgi:nucleotide-binding universal stress UspA family protein
MKNILVALDLSDATPYVLKQAQEMGKLTGAKLWLLHAAAPEPDFVGYDIGPQYVRDARAETLRQEHRQLEAYAANMTQEGIEAAPLLVAGYTGETILAEADKHDADLIIIGSLGHTVLYEVFIGSACIEIVRHSKRPVMTVPVPRQAD